MFSYFSRPLVAVLSGWLAFPAAAGAQDLSTLRQSVEAAWQLSPTARALRNRQAELDARDRAASSLTAGPPTVSLAHRTDQIGSRGGLREYEAELAAPIWSPGVRTATGAQVRSDRISFEQQVALAKLKLAGEVRELAAQAALALIEREVAQRKLTETMVLAAEIERRVKAGEAARIELLQALALIQQAAATQSQAQAASGRVRSQWLALTGLADIAVMDEATGTAREHPAIAAALAQMRAAQDKLALAEVDRRDPMEVGVAFVRERAAAGSPNETFIRLSLRVPLGGDGRNASRLAAARADVDAAQAEAQSATRHAQADLSAAAAELEAARRAEEVAVERARIVGEIHALIARAYRLGESDLPARIRAENERFEAELAHQRARVETRRAVARLNQASGILP